MMMTLKDLFDDMQEAIEDCKDEGYDYSVEVCVMDSYQQTNKTFHIQQENIFSKPKERKPNPLSYLKTKCKRITQRKCAETDLVYISVTVKNEHKYNNWIRCHIDMLPAWEEYQKETEDKE